MRTSIRLELASAMRRLRGNPVVSVTVATALACLGVYGNLAFMVRRRARELRIRRALGGEPGGLMWEVVRASFARVLPGILAGLPIGLGLARGIRSQLYDVASIDPLVLVTATVLVLLVAALAAVIPARRSMNADPLVVLRLV
jgi:ABC-type antimicrobial peptide transport system permease subunit